MEVKIKKNITTESIRVNQGILKKVREYAINVPDMTISRFYNEAAEEKLKKIYDQQIARSTSGRSSNGKGS